GITTLRYTGGSGYEEYYTVDSAGLRNYGAYFYNDTTKSWVFQSYDSPLDITPKNITIGSTYNGSSSYIYYGYTINLYSTVVVNGLEDVVTQSGATFKNAIKITWTLTVQCPALGLNQSDTQEVWFVKNMGIMKRREVSSGEIATVWSSVTHYSSGRKKSELLASADLSGNIYYEYLDENFGGTGHGKLSKAQKLNGDYFLIEYYPSGNKWRENYFNAYDTWQKAIDFYEDGATMRYQWVMDPDIGNAGDVIRYEYDTQGRLTLKYYDDASIVTQNYYGATNNIHYYAEFGPNYDWKKTIEYYEDGATMHYQWVMDPNIGASGDVIRYEYDTQGRLIRWGYDDESSTTRLTNNN
ncbi:MAG: hypothetical protein Q8R48_00005, partial [Candidatus Omnitrophota bacterium]|nr:hypothetical protein [Candidatus Omnitrophota bacterium]